MITSEQFMEMTGMGIISSGPTETTPHGVDEKAPIKERPAEARRECAERKPPEKKPERGGAEHDL